MAQRRSRLADLLGITEPRSAPNVERRPNDDERLINVEWNVVRQVRGEGLLSDMNSGDAFIIVPDIDETPEHLFGMEPRLEPARQWARRLVPRGRL